MLNTLQIGLMTGTIAFVYAVVLVEPGHILFRFKEWLRSFLIKKKKVPEFTAGPDAQFVGFSEVEEETIFWKPLIGCERCVSGQMGLWFYVFYGQYDLLKFLFCISISIITTIILKTFYDYGSNK